MSGIRILSMTIVLITIGAVLFITGIIKYRKEYKFKTFDYFFCNVPIVGLIGGAVIVVPIAAIILSVLFALVELFIIWLWQLN